MHFTYIRNYTTSRLKRQYCLVNHSAVLILLIPVVTIVTTMFNIQQFYVQPTQCIYVFCVDLRTNSDYFPIQHWLTGFYNREGVCLLRGTDWIFKYNSVILGFKVPSHNIISGKVSDLALIWLIRKGQGVKLLRTRFEALASSPLCKLPRHQHVPAIMKYSAHYPAW